jgi:ABC-2 type transport system ATP-binding protein
VTSVVARAAGVTRRFGAVEALRGVDVEIPHGITGLVGPNGAGKSTLLGLLLGLDLPDGGRLELLGGDPTTAGPALRARIGFAPEYDPMPPDVKAQDLVRLVARLHGLDRRTAMERSSDVLGRLGLGEERLREVGTLSTGQKQRVKLAQAIVHDPAFVVLDEPTDGLDPLQRRQMLDLVATLADELSLDVLVSSHLLADLEEVCSHVVVMRDGRVVAQRPTGRSDAGGALVVETVRPSRPLADRLAVAGIAATPLGERQLRIEDGDDAVLRSLRDAIAASGVGLRSLSTPRGTLEDEVVAELAP